MANQQGYITSFSKIFSWVTIKIRANINSVKNWTTFFWEPRQCKVRNWKVWIVLKLVWQRMFSQNLLNMLWTEYSKAQVSGAAFNESVLYCPQVCGQSNAYGVKLTSYPKPYHISHHLRMTKISSTVWPNLLKTDIHYSRIKISHFPHFRLKLLTFLPTQKVHRPNISL